MAFTMAFSMTFKVEDMGATCHPNKSKRHNLRGHDVFHGAMTFTMDLKHHVLPIFALMALAMAPWALRPEK